ncbi:LysR family transcriptional regulator [Puniceibacterium sp. IMCC21224]|uniref:LysR family transcriptional regulator n=1 Tax=Puniceibacterium sp. IMCC21224 TaxID=1618204 RepID=UPI00064DB352|nr:LysR family transcriptional regulator [Puniceibacterium sp. IMCC21224]KMK66158.1 transcriptional regulator [Puniceibacterium sp. IMCC21224]
MIARNLRHLRCFLAVAELGSVTLASARCNVTQPAVTQALARIEAQAGGRLFERTRRGFFLTDRGDVFADRVRRAFSLLDPKLADLSPRLPLTVTTAQLRALIAVCEAENFTLAARRLGLAQPTVHRAVTQLETETGRTLFRRAVQGLIPTPVANTLAHAARLAFSELDQAEADLAEHAGREGGRIVVGALPLSRSVLLPQSLAAFREQRPTLPIKVFDGPYDSLLAGLRRGEIDVIVGALRYPAPIGDVRQEPLFDDRLAIVSRPGHPLAALRGLGPKELTGYPWIVPRADAPLRAQFDAFFGDACGEPPASTIESGSILLMRETLSLGNFLGCVSGQQAKAEIARGLLIRLDVDAAWSGRAIGLTTRKSWLPTRAQRLFLDIMRQMAEPIRSA